ncbi:MAG: hypothetical protein H6765_08210 [Candidatus Peribacteria bacterium]|nr:MAG: hypothetical protein H6765_08210 [Candidatus Peribacteria bacterium]
MTDNTFAGDAIGWRDDGSGHNTTVYVGGIFFTNPLIRAKVQRWQAALSKFLGLSLLALGVKIAMTD